jgi:hypothetical protein
LFLFLFHLQYTSSISAGICGYLDVARIYDSRFTGFLLAWKSFSLFIPCGIVGGMLLEDMWRDGKVGFVAGLFYYAFHTSGVTLAQFSAIPSIAFIYWTPPLLFLMAAHLRVRCGNSTTAAPTSRVALLYLQYFGVEGEHFMWKSVAMQSVGVGLQSFAKLRFIGLVVADGATEGWYWLFFTVLLLNCVVPPLLLSTGGGSLFGCSLPLVCRVTPREAVLLFDVSCDMFYIVGFAVFTGFHQANMEWSFPTGVIEFLSNILPTLRIMSVSRLFMQVRYGKPVLGEGVARCDSLEAGSHRRCRHFPGRQPGSLQVFQYVCLLLLFVRNRKRTLGTQTHAGRASARPTAFWSTVSTTEHGCFYRLGE